MMVTRLVPTVRCSRLAASLAFYTDVLGFQDLEAGDEVADPGSRVLSHGGHLLFLSSHRGDGTFGQAVAVLVKDVGAVFQELRDRGYEPPDRPESPVHRGPVDQTWGTRELYVDDPDGNTIRFIQGFSVG